MSVELTKESIKAHAQAKLEEHINAGVDKFLSENAIKPLSEKCDDKDDDMMEGDDKPTDGKSDDSSDDESEGDEETESTHLTESKYRIYFKDDSEKELTMTSSQLGAYVRDSGDVIAVDDLDKNTKYTIKRNKLIKL